jgi:hypothetical protein
MTMIRQPIDDNFGNERLVTQARPIASNHFRGINNADAGAQWQGLADVFAKGEVLAEKQMLIRSKEDRDRATAWANSKTAEELAQEIKEGKMLSSESPVFVAAVQNIHGRNQYNAMERDVMGRITRGELTFGSPQEADQYITKARNDILTGHGEYTAAGFDREFTTMRPKLLDTVAKVNDRKAVEGATLQSSDVLRNHLLKVTGKDFAGTPEDAAASVMQEYQFLRLTKTLPDGAAKETLKGVIAHAAAGGQHQLVSALLDSRLPDLGPVRGVLGETEAVTLEGRALSHFDQNQRQRLDEESAPWYEQASGGTLNEEKFRAWATSDTNKKYTSAAFVQSLVDRNNAALAARQREMTHAAAQYQVDASVAEAQAQVDAALADGSLYRVQGTGVPKVLTKEGGTKDFNVKEYAEQRLKASTTKLPFNQQVQAWAQNGLENPDWGNQLRAGLHNMASISVDAKGKPTGQLNPEALKALELFREMDAVNQGYARQVAGETAYSRFSDIAFLMHLGRTPSDAATITATAATATNTPGALHGMPAKVRGAVAGMHGTSWADWLANRWGDTQDIGPRIAWAAQGFALGLVGEKNSAPAPVGHAMRNTTGNTYQVHTLVERYATLLAHSGQYGSADEAIEEAVRYISKPEVSVKVNGTLYLRSELPQAPGKESQEEWFGKFIENVPKAQAARQGFSGSEVRVEYSPTTKLYTAMMGGLPMLKDDGMVQTYTRDDIQKWSLDRYKADVNEAVASNKYAIYKARLETEMRKLPFPIERYDPTLNGDFYRARIGSREAFDRITKDGNANKPLADLMKLYPRIKPKQ